MRGQIGNLVNDSRQVTDQLINHRAGQTYATYTALGITNCARPTYAVTNGAARGIGCPYDLTDLYRQIQPKQERYPADGRLSVRIGENVEGYVTGSFSRSYGFRSPAPFHRQSARPSR